MSDYRALGAVTLTLRNLLNDALTRAQDVLPGAKVEIRRPDRREPTEVDRGVINIYLYQTTPNPSWRNSELPTRRADGSLIHQPTLAIDLHFLLSFYGDDAGLVPQLLMGLAMTALHTTPYPPPRYLPRPEDGQGVLRDPLEDKVAGTGLMDQVELLRFAPLQMSHDELSRLWTIFFQIPYTLSTAYLCSVVLLQPELQPEPELPVTRPASVRFNLSHQLPQIEAVKPQVLDYAPGTTVILEGRNLSPTGLGVHIGGHPASLERASTGAAAVRLPAAVRAGMLPVTVSRDVMVGDPPVPRRLFGGSTASLVVRPVLQPPLLYHPAEGDQPPWIEVGAAPHEPQSFSLLLNEKDPPEGRQPRAYTLEPSGRSTSDGRLAFRATGVEDGDYLARLEADGVASTLLVDEDPTSPDYGRFIGPTLRVASGGTP